VNLAKRYEAARQRRTYRHLRPTLGKSRRLPKDSPQWQALRARALERSGGQCQSPLTGAPKLNGLCQGAVDLLAHCDHVLPLAVGGSNHISNLRMLCPICHAMRENRLHRAMGHQQQGKGQLPLDWEAYLWDDGV
jgi:5-methylcytosine-specific restriction endonuclease McrA